MIQSYKLHELLLLCNPLDRIRRLQWQVGIFIVIPEGKFDTFYMSNYTSTPPSLYPKLFHLDDILADDWIKL